MNRADTIAKVQDALRANEANLETAMDDVNYRDDLAALRAIYRTGDNAALGAAYRARVEAELREKAQDAVDDAEDEFNELHARPTREPDFDFGQLLGEICQPLGAKA